MTRSEAARIAGKAGRGACKCRREQMLAFWAKVRAGELPRPRVRGKGRKPRQLELEM